MTVHRLWLLLGVFSAACGTGRADPPAANVDDGGCLDDPVGRSRSPAGCPRDIPSTAYCPTAVPSFAGDVEPILSARCKLCHTLGGVAARVMFDTYDEAFVWYKLMYTQVYACTMPPSCAGPLLDAERRTLLKWFVCKAPPGPLQPIDAAIESGAADAGDEPYEGGDP